jgi:hypothetical protein
MSEKISFNKRFKSVPTQFQLSVPPSVRPMLRFFYLLIATILLVLTIRHVATSNLQAFRSPVEMGLVFVWLAYLACLARGKWREFLVVLCSLVLGLAGLEALALRSESVSPAVVGKGFFAYKPGIGSGAAGPGVFPARKIDPRTGDIIFDATYTIDGSLLRKTESRLDGPIVAFFGDSFTFGEGVNDTETLPQVFADLTGRKLRVLNLGFPGYGPQHVLYQLETGSSAVSQGADLRLLVFLTAPFHAERTSCKPTYTLHSPRYRIREGRVVNDGSCSDGLSLLIRDWAQNTALYRTTVGPYRQRIDRDDIDLYIEIVAAIAERAKEKYGAPTLFAYIGAGDDYLRQTGYTNAMILEGFRKAGLSVIDVSLEKEKAAGAVVEIPGDGHPTPLAHRARAQAIDAYIKAELPSLVATAGTTK